MLLGLSSLMDIIPKAIDGFALHLLDEQSTLPALMTNRVKDGFAWFRSPCLQILSCERQAKQGCQTASSSSSSAAFSLQAQQQGGLQAAHSNVGSHPAMATLKKPVNLLSGIWSILAYRSGGRTTSLLT
jgi:hypothetical protein